MILAREDRFCVRIGWLTPVVLAACSYAQSADGPCSFERALQLHQAQDYNSAATAYRQCLAVRPDWVEARSNLGAVLSRLGRYEDAIQEYRTALRSAGEQAAPRLKFNLALAYYKSNAVPEAAALFEELRQFQPADLNLALLLADCRLRLGEFSRAAEILLPLESSSADNAALDYVLGTALIRDGRIAEGQKRVDRILGRGESAEGHLLLGAALFTAQNYPAARDEFAKAAALNPGLPSLQSYLGQALLFTGDADGAVAAFRRELAANPNDFDANFHFASILARRGDAGEARRLLQRAVQVRPGSSEAKAALASGFQFAPDAPAGLAPGTLAPAIGALDFRRLSRPVVLVFGSYTCPKLRQSAAAINRIAATYRDRVDFRLVYISEAHAHSQDAAAWQSSVNLREGIDLAPPRNLAEKESRAALCVRKLSIPYASVVDGMEEAAEKAYAAWPSRLYVVGRDGRIVYQTALGELDFQPGGLERALASLLSGGRSGDARAH